jgi:methionine synthase II (cobalamin-independent)
MPIALFDYHSREQNIADARFMICARDYMQVLIDEVKSLRKRVLELIQLNNVELQKRIDLQTNFDDLKQVMQDLGKGE